MKKTQHLFFSDVQVSENQNLLLQDDIDKKILKNARLK